MKDSKLPPVGEPAEPEREGPMGTITGVDGAALGTEPVQRLDAPHAEVDPTDAPVPSPERVPPDTERPWMTSLAARGADAGVHGGVLDPDDDEGRSADG